jgi:hypothetical protein
MAVNEYFLSFHTFNTVDMADGHELPSLRLPLTPPHTRAATAAYTRAGPTVAMLIIPQRSHSKPQPSQSLCGQGPTRSTNVRISLRTLLKSYVFSLPLLFISSHLISHLTLHPPTHLSRASLHPHFCSICTPPLTNVCTVHPLPLLLSLAIKLVPCHNPRADPRERGPRSGPHLPVTDVLGSRYESLSPPSRRTLAFFFLIHFIVRLLEVIDAVPKGIHVSVCSGSVSTPHHPFCHSLAFVPYYATN